MFLIWIKFVICVALVVVSGTRLSQYGCSIADRTGLGRVWVGVILLATATSLPEVVTSVGAVLVAGMPDLAMGTLVGSNLFNLLIIAILDVLYRPAPLLTQARARIVHFLSAGVGILLIVVAGAGIFMAGRGNVLQVGWVSGFSIALIVLYMAGVGSIFRFEKAHQINMDEAEIEGMACRDMSLRRVWLGYAISAVVIVASGIWLSTLGKEIAESTGWGASFVGTLLLAIATSLPEMVVSIAAIRMAAVDMAIANMLGSNMFNMGIGVIITDLFLRRGSIFASVSQSHIFTAVAAVVMTVIVVAGLSQRSLKKTPIGISWYAVFLVIIFIAGAYIAFAEGVSF